MLWGVEVTGTDCQFYKNLWLILQICYCINTDEKWKKTKSETKNKLKKREVRSSTVIIHQSLGIINIILIFPLV